MSKVTVTINLKRFTTVEMVIVQFLFNKILIQASRDPSEQIMPYEPLITAVIAKQFCTGHEEHAPTLKPKISLIAIGILQDWHDLFPPGILE
jgi:hypothetical protein